MGHPPGLGERFSAECWGASLRRAGCGTDDPQLYSYGVHGRDFWADLTVGPSNYFVRLKLAATRGLDSMSNCFDIRINGKRVVQALDVAATAGFHRAVDLVFNDVVPQHGAVEVRLTSARRTAGDKLVRGEASLQALELGPGDGGAGAHPVSVAGPEPAGNLLLNPGFEETIHGVTGAPGASGVLAEWGYGLAGATPSYVWQELDYNTHPDWGSPELHSGQGALRTHTDQSGSIRIHQDTEVAANSPYTASVWVRAADLRGKGFGTHPDDSAGLILVEIDGAGKVLTQHEKTQLTKAGPYTRLSRTLTTSPATAQIRFVLESVIHCRYQEGHVTFDDASLVKQAP